MKIEFYFRKLFILFFLFVTNGLFAQLDCVYTLQLSDTFGDGWNGANLEFNIDGEITNYTLNNGDFDEFQIMVTNGETIVVTYSGGAFENEVSYVLIDATGQEILSEGIFPSIGEVYSSTIFCPTCFTIDSESMIITSTGEGEVTLEWEASNSDDYIVEYGESGFTLGDGTVVNTSEPSIVLDELTSSTLYEFYIATDCGDGDVSGLVGPFFIYLSSDGVFQNCFIVIEMYDSFGDGWNGAELSISNNGQDIGLFSVDEQDNDGFFNIVAVPIQEGLITINYSQGTFETEVTYIIRDSEGNQIVSNGPNPAAGEVLSDLILCPSCAPILPGSANYSISDDNEIMLSWNTINTNVTFNLIYGLGCVDIDNPNNTLIENIETNEYLLVGLEPNQLYTYFIVVNCDESESSTSDAPNFLTSYNPCTEIGIFNNLTTAINTANFSFTDPQPGAFYNIEYGLPGTAPGGGILSDAFTTTNFTLNGLSPNTSYVFYIRKECDNGSVNYFGPFEGTTMNLCPMVENIQVTNIGINNADVLWDEIGTVDSYIVEYGPTGFEQGFGTQLTTNINSVALFLNGNVDYDVYVYADCGDDGLGDPDINPVNFTTLPFVFPLGMNEGNECIYTFSLFDSFGDGWNGAELILTMGDEEQILSVPGGIDFSFDFAIFEIVVQSGIEFSVEFISGTFDNEISFTIEDFNGFVVFEQGPDPNEGELFSGVFNCPDCPLISNIDYEEVDGTSVDVFWTPTNFADSYRLEYGEIGFQLGSGTQINVGDVEEFEITGLTPNTWYNVYVAPICESESASTGPIMFKTYPLNDIGIVGFSQPEDTECVHGDVQISVLMENFGSNPQSLVPFFYNLNFMDQTIINPVNGLYTDVIGQDDIHVIDFDNVVDFSEPGYYLFESWTELDNDINISNDTFRYEFVSATPLPFYENFNTRGNNELPNGWTSSVFNNYYFTPEDGDHGVTTRVLGMQIFEFSDDNIYTTHRIGPMNDDSKLEFDYRTVFTAGNNTLAYTFDENDFIRIDGSTDCGETFFELYTIDNETDILSVEFKTVSIDLSEFAGQALNFRITVSNDDGPSFIYDLDNFNISGCPNSLFINNQMSPKITFDENNGYIRAIPTFGLAPFTFEWNDEDNQTTATASNLGLGTYTVVITDANGCSDSRTFVIENPLDVEEINSEVFTKLVLAPNPSDGNTSVSGSLSKVSDMVITVYNLSGKIVSQFDYNNIQDFNIELNLNEQPMGVYYVQLVANQESQIMKLVLTK